MRLQHPHFDRVKNLRAIFERAGFRVRGSRAECPNCSGRSRLTVSVRGELFFCHRCKLGGNIRNLAGAHGCTVPPPRIGRTDNRKMAFRRWLSETMSEIARRENCAHMRAKNATPVLADCPNIEPAWAALADWYHSERLFATFWESASDRIGRYYLYRAWRRNAQ